MNDQNQTGRTVGFFSLSVIIHGLVVCAILAGAAYRILGDHKPEETVTMDVVEPSGESENPGEAQTPAEAPQAVAEEKAAPAVQQPVAAAQPQVAAQPKPVEKGKPVVAAAPVVKKSKPAAKPVTQKSSFKEESSDTEGVDTETQDSEDAPVVAVAPDNKVNAKDGEDTQALAEEAKEDGQKEQEKKAAVAAAVPPRPAETVEPKPVEPKKEEPKAAPVAATTAEAATAQPTPNTSPANGTGTAAQNQAAVAPVQTATAASGGVGNGEGVAKGSGTGVTPSDAKAIGDLRQKPGNRAPRYPMSARKAKQQGEVELTYFVTKQGTVDQIQVTKSSGFASLDAEATQAISRYKFYPGQEGWATHPVNFTLQGNEAQQIGGNNK